MRKSVRWATRFSLSMLLAWWLFIAVILGSCAFIMTNQAYGEEEEEICEGYVYVEQPSNHMSMLIVFTSDPEHDYPTDSKKLYEWTRTKMLLRLECGTYAIVTGNLKRITDQQFFDVRNDTNQEIYMRGDFDGR